MNNPFLSKMEEGLGDEDRRFLHDIHAPVATGTPDFEPWWSLCVTREGYIRFYGYYQRRHMYDAECPVCYQESRDCGLSWKRHFAPDGALCASTYCPMTDRYVRVDWDARGVFALIGTDPDDTHPRRVEITQEPLSGAMLPVWCEQNHRLVAYMSEGRPDVMPWATFGALVISEDGGEHWHVVHIPHTPFFVPEHEGDGIRWQQGGCELSVAELGDGRLMMLSRTSTDFHHVAYSSDGGETWTAWKESPFHGTATMPKHTRLSDGTLIACWCNTRLLPERPDADGVWEDVFTNRDANHIAISHDNGKTWQGFREMELNPYRTASDFRTLGGPEECNDKSVHQFEILELPEKKLLVVCGQHPLCRRFLLVGQDFITSPGRSEDWLHGLSSVSTQTYYEGIRGGSGNTPSAPLAFSGHCAYNRADSTRLIPDPRGNRHEVLLLEKQTDPHLLSDLSGMCWNFAAARRGRVTLEMANPGTGLRLSLCDHWINPTDPTVDRLAMFSCVLPATGEDFYTLTFDFDCDARTASVVTPQGTVDLPLLRAPVAGISYLHLQSAGDAPRAMIARMKMEEN